MLVDQKTDGVVVPLNYALRDVEDIPGALIVRIRESLYFGACCYKVVRSILAFFISKHLSAQRQVQRMHLASMLLTLFFCTAVRLRRFELYGAKPAHPSDAPLRQDAQVLVFHMADVETCDASCVLHSYPIIIAYSPACLGRCKSSTNCSKLTKYADDRQPY